jgi:SdrD B-like domain/Concanavalin A-like lectin/glucanases superfamily
MTKLYTLCNAWCNAVNSKFLNSLFITSILLTTALQSQAQCNNITNGGAICCNQTGIGPFDPAQINNSTTPSGGSGSIEYLWLAKTASSGWNWTTLYEGSNDCYDPAALCETTIYRRCSRRAGCSSWAGESNDVTVTITGGCSPCASYAGTPALANRVSSGIVALYTFQNGTGSTVEDVSGVGTPMNLTIQNPANVSWLPTSGLSINTATTIKTTTAATKLHSALTASGNVSLEAWIKPTNTSQNGPARIMTMSSSSTVRNFTVGQDADNYIARLRTTSGGDNNGLPQLVSPNDAVSEDFAQHVVYTRNSSGQEKLYINGVLVSSATKGGNFSNWVNTMSFALGNELSNDRPWLGKFFLVAVYSQELDLAEVTQNYNAAYPSYCAESCDASITNLVFNNTSTSTQHGIISNGGSYISTALPINWNIEAKTVGAGVGSVRFTFTGDYTATNIQNGAPYRTPDDNTPLNLGPGTYTVKAEVFKLDNAAGIKCGESVISFTILPGTTCVQVQQTCEITQADDHSVWVSDGLKTTLGLSSNNFVQVTPGTLTIYSDGTLKVQGQVKSVANASKKFNYVSYFRYKRNWTNWSSIPHSATPSGYREAKLDAGTSVTITNEYLNWDYYEMDPTKPNTITGIEGLAGLNLTVSHRPSDLRYAAQYGTKGSLQSEGLGFSAWIDLTGNYNSTAINSSGDYNFDLNNCVNGTAFTAAATTVQPTCANICGGSIAINATGGVGNYTYAWSNGATTSSISALCAGSYSCTVTSGNCSQVINVTIAVSGPCCNNVTNGGTIAANQSGCGTFDPAPLTSVSDPSGGTGTLEIIWIKKSASTGGVYQTIAGATGLTYDPPAITETTTYRRCARRAGCTDYVGESNEIVVGVTPCDYDGEICFNGTGNPVGAEVQFHVDYDVNPTLGTVKIRTTLSKNFVDNTYGVNAIGWNNGHTFSNLTGSDHLQLSLYDANNIKKLEFKLDYLTASNATPTGYDCLGVTGGEGQMIVGSATNVLSATTSLDQNFNTYGYVLTSASPASDANYTPNANNPNWIYDVWYEVTVRLDAFGAAGFGTMDISGVHASPSKTGNNTEPVDPGPCPCDAICPTDVTLECGSPMTPDITGAPTSDCNATWTYTDEVCPYADETLPNSGQICFEGTNDQSVGADAQYVINYTNNGNGTLTVRTTFTPNFVDNTYGANAIGWGNGHTFSNLTGSDHLQLSLYDANNIKKLEFKLDYLTASSGSPTGYDCLGVTGGEGQMIVGSAANVIAATTSLDQNFNTYGYVLTSASPATNSSYTPNPTYPNWIYDVWYEVTVNLAAFGPAGFGTIGISGIHASPSKTGNNTEPVVVVECPMPCNGHVSNACEQVIVRHWVSPQAADACDQVITLVDTTAPVFDQQQSNHDLSCTASVPLITPTVSDNCDENVALTYTDVNNCNNSTPSDCDFKTFTQGGWGAPANGNNPGAYRDANFATAFPSGLTIGCAAGNTLTLTSAQAVKDFLPSGSTPSALPSDLVNPGNSYRNVLAGQLTALTLSLGFDAAMPSFAPSPGYLGNGVIASGPFAGTTVSQLVQISNDVIGGCASTYSYSVLNQALTAINENFDGGANQGYINCIVEDQACACTVIRTWTAQDDCGNTSTFTQTFIKGDNEGPVPSSQPADLTLQCNDPIPAMPTITFTDDCSPVVTYNFEEVTEIVGENTVITRVWSANDGCNTTIVDQIITITPCNAALGNYVWYDTNQNGLQDTNETGVQGVTASLYSCAGTFISSLTTNSSGNYLFTGLLPGQSYYVVFTNLPANYVFTAANNGSNEATDSDAALNNGQTACVSLSANQTYLDLDAGISLCSSPQITGTTEPLDVTILCTEQRPAAPILNFYDPIYGSLVATYTEVFQNDNCLGRYYRTWVVTNPCGNTTTIDQIVDIIDNVPPVLMGVPDSNSIECGTPVADAVVSASDNCSTDLIVTMIATTIENACGRSLVRTWSVTDECGNTTSASQTTTMLDTTAPTLLGLPENTTVNCGVLPNLNAFNVTVEDNCDTNVELLASFEDTINGCNTTRTFTWSATDACGNMTTMSRTFTSSDTIAPTFSSLPASATVACGALPLPNSFNVGANDNCDESVTITSDYSDNNQGCQTIRTITWTATDDCGNTAIESRTFTTEDIIAPTLIGVPANTTILCGQTVAPANVNATDNCSDNVEVVMSVTNIPTPCGLSILRTWTAIDACGNTVSATQEITSLDTTPPVITAPGNTTAECNNLPDAGMITATDNCDDNVAITHEDQIVPLDNCEYEIIRTWTATDGCGNISSVSQTILVTDYSQPEFVNAPADIAVDCNNIPSAAAVMATDNCDSDVQVTMNETIDTGCPYTITREWTAIDNCGNSNTTAQIITVQDNVPPVLMGVPDNAILNCGTVAPNEVVYATDNCDNNVTVDMTATTEVNNCGSVFIRIWTATDDCGNTATATQQIDFIDTVVPIVTVSVPAQLSFECNQTIPMNEPKFVDNCDDILDLVYLADTNYTSQCGFDIIRSWTATDNCGNVTNVYQTIHVTDATAPVLLNVPANATAECSSIPAAAAVTAQDNCATNLVVSLNETTTTGCPYTITRAWSATDNCGNTTTQTQIITVIDTAAPTLIGVPANTAAECSALSEAPMVTATDNCDQSIIVSYNQSINQGSGCQYTIVRTWSATDDCNNTTSQSQTITVTDTTPPMLVGVPQNVSVECNEIPQVPVVTATDLCDTDVPVTYNQTMTGGCPNIITRTWTAVDNCGNQTTLSQTITVVDTIAPTFESSPENMTVQCNEIPTVPAMIANDVCDDQVEITYNQTISTGCPYTITRTWHAIDNCGNTTTHVQVISVIDNEYPVLMGVPANATVACGAPVPVGDVFATDNCTDNLNIALTAETITNDCGSVMTRVWTVSDDCGNTTTAMQTITTLDVTPPVLNGVPANTTVNCNNIPTAAVVTALDDCAGVLMTDLVETVGTGCPYAITRTWSATDACGNTASMSQIITVNDTVAPTLNGVPASQTVECSAIPSIATVTATDQCDTDLEIIYDEQEMVLNNCSYQIIRTWSVTDNCGNQTTQSQTLTVVDTTDPTVVSAPQANITAQCDGDLTVIAPTFDDNCDENLNIEFISGISNTTNCSYDIERSWIATDNCGNTATVSQTVHVIDTTAPVLAGVPVETTTSCNNIPAPAVVSATDNCDTTLNVIFNESIVANTCGSTITRTWSVADDCGNTTNASQIINVVDTTNPQIVLDPDDANYECSDALPNITPVFTDNCDTDLTIVPTTEMEELECGYILHKSWTATDNCGNSAVVYQDIFISDTTAPVLIGVPVSYEVECSDIPAAPLVTAQDNCDNNIEVMFTEVQTEGCQYTITRTWTAQDGCGNEVTAQQIIYVVDYTSPILNAPANINVSCSNIPQAPALTATDNCDSDVQVDYEQTQTELDNCTYTITRTWVATDDCNNQSTAVQVITVTDNTAPVFATTLADQTVQCDNIPAAADVTATDNCSDATVTMEESSTNGCAYTITRTWTATDACGNTATLTQHLYVVDEVAPVFASFPEDQTINCNSGTPPVVSVTATDNCDNNVVITTNDMIVNAACGYQIKRTYIATDNCGNAVTGVQMITVIDETPPLVFNVPDDITVGCNAPIPGYSSNVTAQDNCDSTPTITVNDIIVQQECGYLIKRFYNATDDCGNQGAGLQMITVIDETAPQFATIPMDVTVNCGSIPNPAELSATDLCDNSLDYTYSESVISIGCPQQIKRIWTATDNCGNTATAVQVITVIDNDAPVFDDYEVFMQIPCDQVAEFMLTATDGCDNDVEVTIITELLYSGSCYGTLQRTYEATDECGNVTTAMQLIDIIDPTAPVLHNIPAEVYVICGGAVPTVPTNIYATDNCSQDMEITFTEVQTGTFCPYNIIRTWTVTDLCGNTTEATQIIHFTVDVAPVVMLTAFPNPSTSGQIRVMFSVPQDEEVSAIVFDALGRQTQVLLQGTAIGGTLYDWTLNTNNIGTGTYTLRVMVGDDMYIERFILLDN